VRPAVATRQGRGRPEGRALRSLLADREQFGVADRQHEPRRAKHRRRIRLA
jgi:hypothetical protein